MNPRYAVGSYTTRILMGCGLRGADKGRELSVLLTRKDSLSREPEAQCWTRWKHDLSVSSALISPGRHQDQLKRALVGNAGPDRRGSVLTHSHPPHLHSTRTHRLTPSHPCSHAALHTHHRHTGTHTHTLTLNTHTHTTLTHAHSLTDNTGAGV